MRVIAGSARGRRLVAPPGRAVRPTADRVKEALFSSLAPQLPGAVVLDLFAGTGSLAIEALSRGAAWAVLVEQEGPALAAVRENLARARLADRALVLRTDAARFAADPQDGPFDLVLVDPPYAEPMRWVYELLVRLHASGGLTDDALVVIERDSHDDDLDRQPPPPFALERSRSYGDSVLLWLRPEPADARGEPR